MDSAEVYFLLVTGLRGEKNERGLVAYCIERYGFEVLDVIQLPAEKSGSHSVRNSYLDIKCRYLVIASDLCPLAESTFQPLSEVKNGRLSLLKYAEAMLNALVLDLRTFNEPSMEAASLDAPRIRISPAGDHYATCRYLTSHEINQFVRKAKDLECQFTSPFPVEKYFDGVRYNAKVGLVRDGKSYAVLKQFRPNRDDRFERELSSLQHLKDTGLVPLVYDCGPNWILMEYVIGTEIDRKYRSGLIPLSVSRRAMEAAKVLFDAGALLLDYQPLNALVKAGGDIVIIDHESTYIVNTGTQEFLKSPLFSPAALWPFDNSDDYDIKWMAHTYPAGAYVHRWQDRVGLTGYSLLNGSTFSCHSQRLLHRVRRLKSQPRRVARVIRRVSASCV